MDKTKLSILLFILSESIFFILLILAYVFYHGRGVEGIDGKSFLDVGRTGFFTLLLLSSSITVALSMRALSKEKIGAMAFWLFLTIVLGFGFLYGQGSEWWGLIQKDLTISRDLFGATFFTVTGFHGFHVFVGLVLLTILFFITLFKPKNPPKANALDAASWYWHFVDGVWVVVFTVIYLL